MNILRWLELACDVWTWLLGTVAALSFIFFLSALVKGMFLTSFIGFLAMLVFGGVALVANIYSHDYCVRAIKQEMKEAHKKVRARATEGRY